MKINTTIKDARQTAIVKLYPAEGKSYKASATVALTPELVAWIVSNASEFGAGDWLELRANLFESKEDAPSLYDGKAKPSKVGKEKVEYLG